MERVKVTKVQKTDHTWQGRNGLNRDWAVYLEDGRKGISSHQEGNACRFVVGEEATFTSEPHKFHKGWLKLKWTDEAKDFGSPTRGGGKSPEQQQSIIRQHSQEMALRRMEIEIALGCLDKDAYNTDLITAYINWFERDATGTEVKTAPFPTLGEPLPVPPPDMDDMNLDDLPF